MTARGPAHSPGCTCERCWAERTGTAAPPPESVPASRAEFLAALDRAFNAGVAAERQRAAREAERDRQERPAREPPPPRRPAR